MRANERTDERVAQYLRLGFWLIWPTVRWQEAAPMRSHVTPFPAWIWSNLEKERGRERRGGTVSLESS